MARILVIPDLHCPFQHPNAFDFVRSIRDKWDTEETVCLGDEVDFHRISFHTPHPDLPNATEELNQAVKALQPWYKEFPEVNVCTSNHTARPFRRAFEIGLPSVLLKEYREFLQAPKGWQWEDEWWDEDSKVTFIHGENLGSSITALKNSVMKRRVSTIFGHLHSEAGIYYSATSRDLIFAMNAGCLIDTDSLAFAYGKSFALRPVIGCSVLIDGVPYFEPMPLGTKITYKKKSRKVLV